MGACSRNHDQNGHRHESVIGPPSGPAPQHDGAPRGTAWRSIEWSARSLDVYSGNTILQISKSVGTTISHLRYPPTRDLENVSSSCLTAVYLSKIVIALGLHTAHPLSGIRVLSPFSTVFTVTTAPANCA